MDCLEGDWSSELYSDEYGATREQVVFVAFCQRYRRVSLGRRGRYSSTHEFSLGPR